MLKDLIKCCQDCDYGFKDVASTCGDVRWNYLFISKARAFWQAAVDFEAEITRRGGSTGDINRGRLNSGSKTDGKDDFEEAMRLALHAMKEFNDALEKMHTLGLDGKDAAYALIESHRKSCQEALDKEVGRVGH